MSATIWSKFFWSDWANDEALKLCSFAAQGLWMRMLCIAAGANPTGYIIVGSNALDETGIARLTGATVSEVANLLSELEQNGVFSRDRHRRIYSRRMVRDAKKRATAQKNGKLGGNPSLGKDNENAASDKRAVNTRDNTQEPRAKSQERVIEPRAQQTSMPREPKLFNRLCKAAGFDANRLPHPKLLQFGPIRDLIDKGYSLESDVLPVIRDVTASGATFNSWAYIVPIVIERAANRDAIPPKPVPQQENWLDRMKVWHMDQTWAQAWGPKPGEPGCRVPAELIKDAA